MNDVRTNAAKGRRLDYFTINYNVMDLPELEGVIATVKGSGTLIDRMRDLLERATPSCGAALCVEINAALDEVARLETKDKALGPVGAGL